MLQIHFSALFPKAVQMVNSLRNPVIPCSEISNQPLHHLYPIINNPRYTFHTRFILFETIVIPGTGRTPALIAL